MTPLSAQTLSPQLTEALGGGPAGVRRAGKRGGARVGGKRPGEAGQGEKPPGNAARLLLSRLRPHQRSHGRTRLPSVLTVSRSSRWKQ